MYIYTAQLRHQNLLHTQTKVIVGMTASANFQFGQPGERLRIKPYLCDGEALVSG